ncbi:histidine kinase famiy protein [Pseudomonas khorasanensis]|uniref:histidine kinase famiy protein n=1 Tax=Pseudomonas khorasanensis TaxID=2745508 RepID=UPI0021F31608|nr:histidine kinase famiy protein [Pseudomonas khorasanensis]
MPRKSKPIVDSADVAVISQNRKDLFFAAVQVSRMAMIVTDPAQADNPIVFANNAFLELTGYELEEVIGRNCRLLQGEQTDPDALQQIKQALTNQHETCVEVINYRKDGSSFWNEVFIAPLFNERGQLVYFFASQMDVSRRRDAEDGLRYTENMEALGQLTGGIAHDFNNLLQVMIGYIELIQHTAKRPNADPQRIVVGAGHARAAAEKARLLTQHLLAFSRRQRLEGRVINLNALLERSTLPSQESPDLEPRFELADDLWNCRLDPVHAEMALNHLLSNARDALAHHPQPAIIVQTRNVEVPSATDSHQAGLAAGRYVCIAIADNGAGIAAQHLEKVMEPFFTTKEEGNGAGLGLSMVYGFVKQSGGTVRIESTPGLGTTVRLFFPADDNQLWESGAPSGSEKLRGTERILIVEDRAEVAELARLVLSDHGYRTETAADAAQALAMLDSGDYELVFTDLVMPGEMDGLALAREISKRYPSMQILLTTGYCEDKSQRNELADNEFELIAKPYAPIDLLRKLRSLLDR